MTNKPAKDASEFTSKRPHKAREHTDERLILNEFEFYDSQYGEAYRMSCILENTGEVIRLSGKQTYVMDFLKQLDPTEDLPLKFKFVKVGVAFVVEGWGDD